MSKGLPYLLGINIPKVKPETYKPEPEFDLTDLVINSKPLILPTIKKVAKIIPKEIKRKPVERDILKYISQVQKMYGDK